MTKREFQRLKTPVILHIIGPAADPIDYFRVTKIPIGTRTTLYYDLRVGKAYGAFRYINLFSKEESFHLYPFSHTRVTKVPWPQAKREILDLLLGKQQ